MRSAIVYGPVDIFWAYQGAKIKIIILAWLCRFNIGYITGNYLHEERESGEVIAQRYYDIW